MKTWMVIGAVFMLTLYLAMNHTLEVAINVAGGK